MFSLEIINAMNEKAYQNYMNNKKQYSVSLKLSVLDIEKLLLVEELLEELYYQYPEIEAVYMLIEDLNKKILNL